MKDPNLIYSQLVEFANYPGGRNESFPYTFKQLFRKVCEYIKEEHSGGKESQFPTFVDGHQGRIFTNQGKGY